MKVKYLSLIALSLAIAGCSLFKPIQKPKVDHVVDVAIGERDAELNDIAARNKKIRQEQAGPVMNAPAHSDSGLIGEVDIDKTLSRNGTNESHGKGPASAVKLEFSDTSLKDIITVFMQDYLKKPYSFQESFKDRKVNLFFNAMATQSDLIKLFDTLLENYGVRLRYSGGMYLIGSNEDKANPMQQPSPLGIGDAIGVFRLNYVNGTQFLNLAKQVVKYPDKVTTLPGEVIVVNSNSIDVRAVRMLIEDVDVPVFAGKYILVYTPRYLSAASLAAVLDSTQVQLSATAGTNKQFEAKQILGSERIVIIAANKAARNLVLQLLNQTDVVNAHQRRVFKYSLGSQIANDILANLNILVKDVIKNTTEVNIIADKASNSLFIYASPDEYAQIRKLIASMDFRPPAVQVDMIIAEVTLNDEMRYGVQWYLKKTGRLIGDTTNNLGIPAGITPNLSFNIVDQLNNYATLQLLGSQTSFSLLSNPKIVVKNGATARILVGQEQPVIGSKSSTAVAGTTGTTVIVPEFKKIGLELEVTPTVSADNEVRMIIKLKNTTITGTITLGGTTDSYPILANRELTTDLVVDDGHTVFLGGMRQKSATDSASKVPGLGDIGGIGAMFRNKDTLNNGNELIILVTPTVMLDQQGADIVTSAMLRASRRDMDDLRTTDTQSPAAPTVAAPDTPAPTVNPGAIKP